MTHYWYLVLISMQNTQYLGRAMCCWRSANRGVDLILTVYPKKYAHGFCFAVLCYGYTLTDFPISIRLTSLALWQSNDCPSASKATLMNVDKYFMWIHYERLHNHNKAKHNKTVCIFLGIYCIHLVWAAIGIPYFNAISLEWAIDLCKCKMIAQHACMLWT